MNYKNQYNGSLSLRSVVGGINLSILNSYRLLSSAKTLFNAKDFAGAVALAILALEENGKYLTLIPLLSEGSEETKWRKVRKHKCKTKEINALLAIMRLLKENKLQEGEIKRDFILTDEVGDILDALKQKALYVDCVSGGIWQHPLDLFDARIALSIMLLVNLVMRESPFTEQEIKVLCERALGGKDVVDESNLYAEATKEVLLNLLLEDSKSKRFCADLDLSQMGML